MHYYHSRDQANPAMDFPTVKGIHVESAFKAENAEAQRRMECVTNLTDWASNCGFISRDTVKFVVAEDGLVRCKATRFIPAGKHIMHVPFKLDLSYTALKNEVIANNAWQGWMDLKARVKMFAKAFRWHPYNADQKDNFSKNLLLVMTIIGVLKKLNSSPNLDQESHILKTFSHYWHSLPASVGSVLLDWTETELAVLQGTSFFNCLPDAKRFGVELFQLVVVPFIAQYPEIFGETIDFETFMRINCVVCSRSFSTTSNKAKFFDCKLIPIIDLLNGKTNDQHNCSLENCAIQKEVDGEFIKFHALDSVCDINAGDEIFLEYAQVGNGRYLLSYDIIPLDPGVIMNNQKTDVFLDFGEFLDTELLRMHPNAPTVRKMKKSHIYGFFNLPRVIGVSMDDLFSTEYTCIPAIRQVLIFLLCNEEDACRAIASSKIKSQFEPPHVFLLFGRFIEVTLGKPDIAKFRSLLTSPSTATSSSVTLNNASAVGPSAAATAAKSLGPVPPPAPLAPAAPATKGAAGAKKSASAAEPKDSNKDGGTKDNSKDSGANQDAAKQSSPSGSNSSSPVVLGKKSNKTLTANMKSAIFLHMSERLVIEVMINRFINLFPDSYHEIGYSILSNHLVSTEINTILDQLCRPANVARASTCMVCGATGPISKCSRCKVAFYCSAACQKEHWMHHKKTCGKSLS